MVEDERESKTTTGGCDGGRGMWRHLTSFQKDLLAGAVMGGMVHTIVAPIERAKLLLQTQESNMAIVAGKHRRFRGMFDCILRTVREEGFLSLWRGNGSSVLRYYPSVALNFSLKVLQVFVGLNGTVGMYGCPFVVQNLLANVISENCMGLSLRNSQMLLRWWNKLERDCAEDGN